MEPIDVAMVTNMGVSKVCQHYGHSLPLYLEKIKSMSCKDNRLAGWYCVKEGEGSRRRDREGGEKRRRRSFKDRREMEEPRGVSLEEMH